MDRMKVPLKSIERAESAESLNDVYLFLHNRVDTYSKCRLTLFCGVLSYDQNLLCIFDITSPARLCQVSGVAHTSLCSFSYKKYYFKNT